MSAHRGPGAVAVGERRKVRGEVVGVAAAVLVLERVHFVLAPVRHCHALQNQAWARVNGARGRVIRVALRIRTGQGRSRSGYACAPVVQLGMCWGKPNNRRHCFPRALMRHGGCSAPALAPTPATSRGSACAHLASVREGLMGRLAVAADKDLELDAHGVEAKPVLVAAGAAAAAVGEPAQPVQLGLGHAKAGV